MNKTYRKKKLAVLFLLCLILACVIFFVWIYLTEEKKMKFTETDRVLDNPSRGWYIQADSAELSKISKIREEGVRLVLIAFDLEEYRSATIPKAKLNELDAMFQELRSFGMKAIVRAAYGFNDTGVKDADSLERIGEHIQQFAECVNRNTDVVLCVQAGFLGPWGEWHSSVFLSGTEQENKKVRQTVIKQLADALAPEVVLNLRRPRFLREAVEAGIAPTRLGYHNDGLLSTDSDYGTYDDPKYSRKQELAYLASAGFSGINGGEMPKISEYSEPENVLVEFPQLNLTYLNLKYNEYVIEDWKQKELDGRSAFDYIGMHLGYRYRLETAVVPKNWFRKPFLGPKLTFTFCNDGFAPVESGYLSELVLKMEDGTILTYPFSLPLEIVRSGQELTVSMRLPRGEKGAGFVAGIRIYDSSAVDKRERFCIELANEGILYENGVNYFIKINADGGTVPIR